MYGHTIYYQVHNYHGVMNSNIKIGIYIILYLILIENVYAADIVVPSGKIVTNGQDFILNISIDPKGTAIAGAYLNIEFNKTFFNINSITEGDLFKQNGANTFFNPGVINNSSGIVLQTYDVVLGHSNVSAPGTFIVINLTAIGLSGKSAINISSVKVSDPDGIIIKSNITNGSIIINATTLDTTPPASIINLKNISYAQNSINWTWDNPYDPDFYKVMVYINGMFKGYVPKVVRFYNATNLTPGNSYTISTHTVDVSGNINSTWLNHTASTNYNYANSSYPLNLVANPGFENIAGSLMNWSLVTNNSNIPLWDTSYHTGARSIKISIPGYRNSASGYPKSDFIIAAPLQNYTLSAWVKTSNVQGIGAPAVKVVELDANKKLILKTTLSFSKGTNNWNNKQKTFKTNSNTQYLYVYADITNGRGTFWVDDVNLSFSSR
jgi:hypothetical protein